MIRRVNTEAHESAGDGDASKLNKAAKLGTGIDAAAANVENRAARLGNQPEDLFKMRPFWGFWKARDVSREAYWGGPVRYGHLLLDVLRNVDKYGAWTTGGGEEEGFLDDPRNVIDVEDKVVVLGDGAGDLNDGCFLEGVSADHAAGNLTSDSDDGDGIEKAVSQGGDEVGRARTGCGDADAGAAGGPGIALGGEGFTLLMP